MKAILLLVLGALSALSASAVQISNVYILGTGTFDATSNSDTPVNWTFYPPTWSSHSQGQTVVANSSFGAGFSGAFDPTGDFSSVSILGDDMDYVEFTATGSGVVSVSAYYWTIYANGTSQSGYGSTSINATGNVSVSFYHPSYPWMSGSVTYQ